MKLRTFLLMASTVMLSTVATAQVVLTLGPPPMCSIREVPYVAECILFGQLLVFA